MKNYNVSDEPVTKVAVDIDDIKDTSREKSLNKECVFLMAGRMIYRKGLDFLFDALISLLLIVCRLYMKIMKGIAGLAREEE